MNRMGAGMCSDEWRVTVPTRPDRSANAPCRHSGREYADQGEPEKWRIDLSRDLAGNAGVGVGVAGWTWIANNVPVNFESECGTDGRRPRLVPYVGVEVGDERPHDQEALLDGPDLVSQRGQDYEVVRDNASGFIAATEWVWKAQGDTRFSAPIHG